MDILQEAEAQISTGRRSGPRSKKYAPATGIQQDFEKVLTTFVETKSVRYEEFAKIWREKKMSLLCAGRQTDREAVEFTEECMKMGVKMCLPPYGFQARVGALYLLYGVYLTQPCLPKVKIRLTHSDWEHFTSLREEFGNQNHHDANFILHRLLLDGAFHFCALTDEVRSRHTHTDEGNKSMMESLKEDRQRIDDLFSGDTLQQVDMIHGQYHQQKVRLAGPDASRPDRSLDVLHDKFPALVKQQLEQHHEQWKTKESSRQGRRPQTQTFQSPGDSDEIESDPDYQPGGSVGQRRAKLRAIAFRGTKNKQRYKHRTLATEGSSSEDRNASPKKKRGRPRGARSLSTIKRATMSTIREHDEEGVSSTTTQGLLDMPVFDLGTTEDKKPGRKRKVRPDTDGPTKPKQGRPSGKTASKQDTHQASDGDISPPKKGPGRPPKPKTHTPGAIRKVGRPKKVQIVTGKAKPGRPKKVQIVTGNAKPGRPKNVQIVTGKAKPGRPKKVKIDPSQTKPESSGDTGTKETQGKNETETQGMEESCKQTGDALSAETHLADSANTQGLQSQSSQPTSSTTKTAKETKTKQVASASEPVSAKEPELFSADEPSGVCEGDEGGGEGEVTQSGSGVTQSGSGVTQLAEGSGVTGNSVEGISGGKTDKGGKAARLKVTPLQVKLPMKGVKKTN